MRLSKLPSRPRSKNSADIVHDGVIASVIDTTEHMLGFSEQNRDVSGE